MTCKRSMHPVCRPLTIDRIILFQKIFIQLSLKAVLITLRSFLSLYKVIHQMICTLLYTPYDSRSRHRFYRTPVSDFHITSKYPLATWNSSVCNVWYLRRKNNFRSCWNLVFKRTSSDDAMRRGGRHYIWLSFFSLIHYAFVPRSSPARSSPLG